MKRAVPALFAAVLLALGGCGSSTLTASELRDGAAGICRPANASLNRVPQPASPNGALPFLRRGVAVLGPELDGLRQLAPPAALATRYHAAVAELSIAVQRLRATITLLERGADPIGAFNALEHQLKPIVASENSGWSALQIAACVSR